MVSDPQDEPLALEAGRGSSEAFAALVQRYEGRVYNYLLRRTATRADAEDLTQETFLRAWSAAGRFDPHTARYATWIFTIASRLAISAGRRRRNDALEPERVEAPTDEPVVEAARSDDRRALWDLVDTLPDEPRSMLWLRYAEECSTAEIAEILGRSPGAIRVALHRARQRLATLWTRQASPTSSRGSAP